MRRALPRRQSLALLAGVILMSPFGAGCGGSDSGGGSSAAAGALTADEANANLKDAGYVVDKVTNGANKAIGPNGKLDADVYLGVNESPDGGSLYVGGYFFSDPADRQAYATWAQVDHVTGEKREVQPVVEGQGVFTSAGESQDELDQVVETARGG
ncbi:MAG: hypothetical protein ACJ780_27610 [Solirubrobacteraceae bacterium]